jgi:hypothetical protein
MNERMTVLSFTDGEVGITLGDNYRYFTVPVDLTVVYIAASPNADDAGLTIDLNDDGAAAVAAVACPTAAVPGRWRSTHVGGTNAPVRIAAGSVCSLDANAAAVDTRIHVEIWALTGEVNA